MGYTLTTRSTRTIPENFEKKNKKKSSDNWAHLPSGVAYRSRPSHTAEQYFNVAKALDRAARAPRTRGGGRVAGESPRPTLAPPLAPPAAPAPPTRAPPPMRILIVFGRGACGEGARGGSAGRGPLQ